MTVARRPSRKRCSRWGRPARPDSVARAGRRDCRISEHIDGDLSLYPRDGGITMRLMPAAAAVPVVLVLLTWLSFRASNTDAERFDRALGALDRFALVESALQRDVLSARAGMLRN